jgi:hypothetical protein
MPDPDEKLTPADPDELAAALAFALKFECRKRQHDADAFMANIVAKRFVRYLERARFVVASAARRCKLMAGAGRSRQKT